MTLISNDCTGGFYCQYNNKQYDNVLIWTSIEDIHEFIYLIEHYSEIDWSNYTINIGSTKFDNNPTFLQGSKCPIMNVDKHIHLWFSHYCYHPDYSEPILDSVNRRIYCNKIEGIVLPKAGHWSR